MKQLVDAAIQALTALDAERLDQLRADLAAYRDNPPSSAELLAALPGQRVLGALLRETERNLRLFQRTSSIVAVRTTGREDAWPEAWQQRSGRQHPRPSGPEEVPGAIRTCFHPVLLEKNHGEDRHGDT